ncbi:UDP-glucuronosyltransferase 2B7-like [Amphiura filiformis]|uniref:UDP-glucuronosyltransferase 2B7-like n=1 Tax=Amphiura filiformis TaxID=82378 RepID=UPI003B21E4E7
MEFIMASSVMHDDTRAAWKLNLGIIMKYTAALIVCATVVDAGNFLIVLGPDKGSMMFTTIAIGDALVERGQNVTVLVNEGNANRIRNHNSKFRVEMHTSSVTEAEVNNVEQQTTARALAGDGFWTGWYWSVEMMDGLFYRQCRDLLEQDDVIKRIRDSEFDLVLASLGHVCPVLIAKHIDVPFVGLMQSFLPVAFAHVYHQPVDSAYMPPAFTGWTDRMSFHQRLMSSLISILNWPSFWNEPLTFPNFSQLKDQFNISRDKSLMRTMGDAELWFVMSHPALDYPRPVMPDTISIGGLTTKPSNPLEKKFEDFMQSSGDDGVLLFTMGTTTQGANKEFANIFAKAFAQVPHKVIWKLSGDPPEDTPSNVMVTKWLPQNDLLGHPKTKIHVSHCGLNGVYEALYHAVPIVCIPMFGDHHDAAARVKSKGIGVEVALEGLTSAAVVDAVKTVMEDNRYRDNIQRLSAIYRDETLSPAHRCAYWMEYVVRHGSVKHLRSAAHHLNFAQYHLLDVLAVLLTLFAVLLGLIFCIFKTLCRCCCRIFCGQKVKND